MHFCSDAKPLFWETGISGRSLHVQVRGPTGFGRTGTLAM